MHRHEIENMNQARLEKLIRNTENIRKNVNLILSILKITIIMGCFGVVLYAPYTFGYWGCLVGLLLMSVEMILSFMLDQE